MSQGAQITDDERTNAVGLFNTARSYWRSAEYLSAAQLKLSHPEAPVTFLFCHSIELYLKAFLRAKGCSLIELKKWGHNVAKLADEATARQINLDGPTRETVSHITEADVALEARYIVTGFKTVPTDEALSNAAEKLDTVVSGMMQAAGLSVRKQAFEKPLPSKVQDELCQIEDDLSELTQQEREILAYLLHHNQRMFECPWDGGNARLLIARGIVRNAQRKDQLVDYRNVPMEIPRPVWNLLLKHRAKFPYTPSKDGGQPWRVHWMAK